MSAGSAQPRASVVDRKVRVCDPCNALCPRAMEACESSVAGQSPSGSSIDPEPKRTKLTSVTDNENLADRVDKDNFRRGPATFHHQLEPVNDENVSKKARVARNVLHIRGEDNVKFDVNEEAWPNADLVIRASNEGALIDGLPADKVKAGDEREIKYMTDLQQIDPAHRLGSTNEGE